MKIMSEETKPEPSPDADAVAALLRGDAVDEGPEEVKLDLDNKTLKSLGVEEDPEETPRVTTPLDETFNLNGPDEKNFMAWAFKTPDIEKEIQVSEEEKAIYLKAVLNDEAVSFVVSLPVGDTDRIRIRVKTLTVADMDLVFYALNKDEEDKLIKDPAQYATTMQRYAASFQVEAVNDKPIQTFVPDHDAPINKQVEALRKHSQNMARITNHARWHYVLMALRIFTVKIKIMTDAALNRDFW